MLATLTKDYFSDPGWVFEPKLDGIRCLAFKKGKRVRLLSRNKLDLTAGYPSITKALETQTSDFIIDGEIAALSGDRTSFGLLQQSRRSSVAVLYFVFDVIHLDGYDMTPAGLLDRKKVLRGGFRWRKPLTFVEHKVGEGEAYLEEACGRGWEGLIAKRADASYTKGRSKDWLKFKCSNEQELVICGFTDPQGARTDFGALIVGYHQDGKLQYAGKVGTGYSSTTLRELRAEMEPLIVDRSPFEGKPPIRKNVHWLKPKLVAQIAFAEWTGDGRLRHPRFLGLRRDKKAKEVVRES